MFITDSEIVKNITKEYDSVSLDTIPLILTELPNIIKFMEEKYKALRGSEKKRLVIIIIINLMKISGMKEEDVSFVYELLPNMIDTIVDLANTSSQFFKKVKKSKLCCYSST